ncbi:MAG: TerC/Alx family metal homeostasis membrane protein [Actinomycetota bacterium]|nr:TerC/Alx family metal homeostasis membrane protein [Actinomycetota bacterium]
MTDSVTPYLALGVALVVFLFVDLKLFARGREGTFREGAIWSLGWLAISLLAGVVVWVLASAEDAVVYVTVYLIERSLSLDNLFVFLLLFTYFAVPSRARPRLLFFGIVAALALRGLAIGAGVALINQFHFLIYVLGVALLLLAYRVFKGVEESVHPDKNLMVRAVRKVFPVTGELHGQRWFVRLGKLHATPLFLCLAAIVFADLAFAIDSIPAAFAITREPLLIWMGNVFALLGLRALFVLLEELVKRFRFLDETIAVVLGLVAVKMLTEDLGVHVGPVASLVVILGLLAAGIVASILADRWDPEAERKQQERRDRVGGEVAEQPGAGKEEAAATT